MATIYRMTEKNKPTEELIFGVMSGSTAMDEDKGNIKFILKIQFQNFNLDIYWYLNENINYYH